MELYILKFSACLLAFISFYKLFLERESMHHLKRYFLLAALILSVCIPLITFTQYIEPEYTLGSFQNPLIEELIYVEELPDEKIWQEYLPQILWTIYWIGFTVFTFRFLRHLTLLVLKIKRNPKYKNQSFINVLLSETIEPHTFFNYIFLNKKRFENQDIPTEVFIHEQTHAKQLHTLDILFIELFQIVFWFHPLVYFIKKDIKLNHEFLADASVLNQGTELSTYQKLLLAFSSNANQQPLANAINYSSFKKRFTVMKTHTSKTRAWLKSLIVLPLLAVLIYSFSSEKIEYREVDPKIEFDNSIVENLKPELKKAESLQINYVIDKETYYKNVTIKIIDGNGNITYKKYNELTDEQKERLIPPPSKPNKKRPTKAQLNQWLDSKKYGVWLDGNQIKNTELKNYSPSDFGMFMISKLEKNAINYGKHYYQVNMYSNKKFEEQFLKEIKPLPENTKITLQTNATVNIYDKLAKKYTDALAIWLKGDRKDNSSLKPLKNQADNAYKLISKKDIIKFKVKETPPLPADYNSYNQEGITEEELKKYNLWAIKVNGMIANDDNIIVKIKDMKYMKNLYNRMTVTQQKSAEPFPNFPPPPPPPRPTEIIEVQEIPSPTSPPNPNLEEIIEVEEIIEEKHEALNNLKKVRKSQEGEMIEVVEEIQEPKTGFITINEQTLYYVKENGKTRYFNRWGQKVDRKGNIIDPEQTHAEDVIKGRVVKKVYKNNKVVAEFDTNNVSIPAPPPPPPTPNMEKLAEKGATFYYEGKKISSKKAIKIYKENSELNVLIKDHDTKPNVKLSKEPIEAFPSKNIKHYKLKSATVLKKPYKVDNVNFKAKKEGPRKIYIAVSSKGEYSIAKEGNDLNFDTISLESIDKIISKLNNNEIENTFLFTSTRDLKKYRSKPSNYEPYQNDIEIWLVKADYPKNSSFKFEGKEKKIFHLVFDNKEGNLRSFVNPIIKILKKYGVKNISF